MIVDDVFVSIAYTKLALGDEYDIITCLGGSKAATMAVAEKPDLILMDYEMPDIDGMRKNTTQFTNESTPLKMIDFAAPFSSGVVM